MKTENKFRRAVCLLSGGLDSATVLYQAKQDGYDCIALTFSYGQLHGREVKAAERLAREIGAEHHLIQVSLPWGGSALLDAGIPVPLNRSKREMNQGIPSTYVPARNTIFLSYAMSLAEVKDAEIILIGANVLDYSGYPDCRPGYLKAFEDVIRLGSKAGEEGRTIRIEAPLLHKNKGEIVAWGTRIGVPFEKTWSCYLGLEHPCGECDACLLRAKGFAEAGIADPLNADLAFEQDKK